MLILAFPKLINEKRKCICMSRAVELGQSKGASNDGAAATVGSVVLDREGIICAAEFKGFAFDGDHGWPEVDIVGLPFASIHEMQHVSMSEMSRGVERVCHGSVENFRYRFDLQESCDGCLCEYELLADHESLGSESVVVTYAYISSSNQSGGDASGSADSATTAPVSSDSISSESHASGSNSSSLEPSSPASSYGSSSPNSTSLGSVGPSPSDQKSLVQNTNLYQSLFDRVPIGIVYQNNRGIIKLVNPAGEKVLGVRQEEVSKIRKKNMPWDCIDESGAVVPLDKFPSFVTLATGEAQQDALVGIKRKGGEVSWIRASSELVFDSNTGKRMGVQTTFVDVTQEREAKAELEAQKDRAQMAIDSAEMGVWDWNPSKNTMVWDEKLFQIYGYQGKSVISSLDAWKKAIHPDDAARVMREASDMMVTGKKKSINYRSLWPNGSVKNLRSQARPIKNAEGKVIRVIGVTHDVTNEVMAEKQLWDLAYTDALTGASSRAGLNFRLSRSVARALQRDGQFLVLMFGLNRFKEINDNYSLSAGDKILCEIARRTKSYIGSNDTVARVGGDEFMVVLEYVGPEFNLDSFVHDFRDEVFKPVPLNEGLMVNLSASLGVSVFPDDGGDAAALQTNAGMAMQADRIRDDENYVRYSPAMSAEVSRKFKLKYQLFGAVKEQEFQLYYQPIIDLHRDNKVIGCEALIRWKDSSGNFVSPMEFIPVIEESGLIYELGEWINVTAIKQWKMWQQLVPDLQYISVNVSPRQLEHPNFVEDLMKLINEYQVKPENFQLEITEGTFLNESVNSDGMLQQLADHGFRLAIDDFGTGYSSLAYLKRFNVDVIKIDRSFIIDIETDSSDRDIVSAILAMNKKLGFKTLVEGIETESQSQIVYDLGCDSAQGYLYGRPTFADEFAEMYIRSNGQVP